MNCPGNWIQGSGIANTESGGEGQGGLGGGRPFFVFPTPYTPFPIPYQGIRYPTPFQLFCDFK